MPGYWGILGESSWSPLGLQLTFLTCRPGAHIFEYAVFIYSLPVVISDFPLIHLSTRRHCNIPFDIIFLFLNNKEKRKQMKCDHPCKVH